MRRQFVLPEADREYLGSLGHPWETLKDGPAGWLLLDAFEVPSGYNVSKVAVALRIEPGYPDSQIDMAYFHPPLARQDGKAIRALADIAIDGRMWQRWSRHRTEKNKWRAGEDDIGTQLLLVRHWLELELRK